MIAPTALALLISVIIIPRCARALSWIETTSTSCDTVCATANLTAVRANNLNDSAHVCSYHARNDVFWHRRNGCFGGHVNARNECVIGRPDEDGLAYVPTWNLHGNSSSTFRCLCRDQGTKILWQTTRATACPDVCRGVGLCPMLIGNIGPPMYVCSATWTQSVSNVILTGYNWVHLDNVRQCVISLNSSSVERSSNYQCMCQNCARSMSPTTTPTDTPTVEPTSSPTLPTSAPTSAPSTAPLSSATSTAVPTKFPINTPSHHPTLSPHRKFENITITIQLVGISWNLTWNDIVLLGISQQIKGNAILLHRNSTNGLTVLTISINPISTNIAINITKLNNYIREKTGDTRVQVIGIQYDRTNDRSEKNVHQMDRRWIFILICAGGLCLFGLVGILVCVCRKQWRIAMHERNVLRMLDQVSVTSGGGQTPR